MGKVSDTTEEERVVIRECIKEAFWYRSLPLGVAATLSVYYAVKAGKIRSTRYGTWPVVVGAGSLAYVVGKLTYIFGENCSKKFLEKAPNSEITAQLRLKYGKNSSENIEDAWKSKATIVAERNLGFADILDDFDFNAISDVEKSIMNDCNSTAFWQYSLPLSLISSGAVYSAIKSGLLNASKRVTHFPRLPKMVVGCTIGYIAGQWLYVYSRDCTNRFLSFAPDGEIARRLRGEVVEERDLLCSNCREEEEVLGDYVLPTEMNDQIDQIIKDQCGID